MVSIDHRMKPEQRAKVSAAHPVDQDFPAGLGTSIWTISIAMDYLDQCMRLRMYFFMRNFSPNRAGAASTALHKARSFLKVGITNRASTPRQNCCCTDWFARSHELARSCMRR